MRFALLMPAAGSGIRLGSDIPKALLDLAGVPMFVHAVRPFLRFTECIEVVIAAPRSWEEQFLMAAERIRNPNPIRIITGGAERQDSVRLALHELKSGANNVLVHDAARPLVNDSVIRCVLDALESCEAAVAAVKTADTLKRTDAALRIGETIDRTNIIAAQTPQGIRRSVFEEAHHRAQTDGFRGTDDVSLVERYGLAVVQAVTGDPVNFKITTGEDLALARKILKLDA